jgi:hypothetical protein
MSSGSRVPERDDALIGAKRQAGLSSAPGALERDHALIGAKHRPTNGAKPIYRKLAAVHIPTTGHLIPAG